MEKGTEEESSGWWLGVWWWCLVSVVVQVADCSSAGRLLLVAPGGRVLERRSRPGAVAVSGRQALRAKMRAPVS